MSLKVVCPKCRNSEELVARDNPFFPFCSERCRDADLTAWLDESYRVPHQTAEDDDLTQREFEE